MFVEYLIALPVTPTYKVLRGIQNQNMNGFLSNTGNFLIQKQIVILIFLRVMLMVVMIMRK